MIDTPSYWAQVAEDLNKRPNLVARMRGREETGYLSKVRKSNAPLTLAEIGELYYGEGREVQDNDRSNLSPLFLTETGHLAPDRYRRLVTEHS